MPLVAASPHLELEITIIVCRDTAWGREGGGQLANKIIYEMCNIFATSSGSHLYCCFLFYLANCSSVEISRGVRKLVDCLQVTTSGRCSPATARRW